jgi:hypothetical protein
MPFPRPIFPCQQAWFVALEPERQLTLQTIFLPLVSAKWLSEMTFVTMNFHISLLFAGLLGCSTSAQASFHLFDIQEVFSNGDGTVQFIELFTTFGSQQFLGGHSVTFQTNGVTQQTLNLSNLGSDSANKAVLLGTSNLTTLYGVTPDFVIPTNFFAQGANNSINFGSGTDIVSLALLPVNGTSSLDGMVSDAGTSSSNTAVNAQATPRNFAGQTATIPEPSGILLMGLTATLTPLVRRRGRSFQKHQKPVCEADSF